MGIGRKVKFRYYISFFLLLDLKDQNAIVKEILQTHGENIDVISTVGVGTEFIFSLPASKET